MAKQSCCGSSSSSRNVKYRFVTLPKPLSTSDEGKTPVQSACCGGVGNLTYTKRQRKSKNASGVDRWVIDLVETPVGKIRRVSTQLDIRDVLGSWKCRWSNGRMDYKVDPGLYCVGTPDNQSPVLVTSNYKMTFDRVRKELENISAWILVLDTDGVNVWCAAGKGADSSY